VPITAYPPSPAFQVDRTKIDFGTVLIQSSQIQRFRLKNCGTIEGKFTIPCDYQFLTVEPQSGLLRPTESATISLTFRAPQPGGYEFSVTPKVEGNYDKIDSIVTVAKVVDHSIALTDLQDSKISEVDFGSLFFGQRRGAKIKLSNNGAIARMFTISGPQDHINKFSVSPTEGKLSAHSSVDLVTTFATDVNLHAPDLEHLFTDVVNVSVPETGQVIELRLVGMAVPLSFNVTAVDFDFSPIVVRTKMTQTFTLSNSSQFLPLSFAVKKASHFEFVPARGTIRPKDSKEIALTFYPKNLGPFEYQTRIMFCDGLAARVVHLTGMVVTAIDGKTFRRAEVWEDDSDAAFFAKHPVRCGG
jgi:hypothetical protein